jgi:DNA modification methylase
VKLPWSELKNQNQRSIVSTTTEFTRSHKAGRTILEKSAFIWRIDKKHSNENDVVDTFLGAGTTAIACRTPNEDLGVQLSKEYFDKVKN